MGTERQIHPGGATRDTGDDEPMGEPMSDEHVLAQALHDLGAAVWFGGSVMGVVGVNSSGADLEAGIDRVRVASSAWNRFAPIQWAGIAATVGAGLRLTQVGGRRLALQEGFGRTGAVKAAVTLLGAAATAYAAYCGQRIGTLAEDVHERGEPLEVRDATRPTAATPAEIARWQGRQRLVQYAVPLLAGANIALNSSLVQSYRAGATATGVARRILPV